MSPDRAYLTILQRQSQRRYQSFGPPPGLSMPNGWGRWNVTLCLLTNILRGWRNAFPHGHLFLIPSAPQQLSILSQQWSSNHNQRRADVHPWFIPHITRKEMDQLTRLVSWRVIGALKHLEKNSSCSWMLVGSNGSAEQRTVIAADGNCLILQIEEMKHRETTGWLIVEMKVEATCYDFQSTQPKSSLPHPRSHFVNILRAGPAPLICFTSVASNLSWFADPFMLSNRAVHSNLLTTGLLPLAFLHILHVACGSSWAKTTVCSLQPFLQIPVYPSSYWSLPTTTARSRRFQSSPNSI